MTQDEFHKLVHVVMDSPAKPPENLFAGGMDNWRARARLAHFLAMEGIDKNDEALELFHSVVEAEPNEDIAEEVEEKVFALQRLSSLERSLGQHDDALRHINMAIELAESTDFLYKYILRGELWADRWNLMHQMDMTADAETEADERIAAYKDIPIEHNSYLYYGYRFKAQLSAERGVTLVAKDYMHMALHSMEIPESYQAGLDKAFAATHDNASWILTQVDKATPNPDNLHWDI
ncbi:MAG: tetratricopeptide repeat protein [Selenomonas sp.]|jgi:tetratricopeptide (TPR) repeat protein|nr:tetratricopeptide repeat protein [Selenomonas sp.]MBQ4212787.1 tetratricopeptide repeat protein [Selenomonas sp.]MBQ5418681.1 tetratricopeptide repeat protein [Selenomonas sp.]MBQ5502845.1 tetratricopeptide repeat protein [Selenomonas sp.]